MRCIISGHEQQAKPGGISTAKVQTCICAMVHDWIGPDFLETYRPLKRPHLAGCGRCLIARLRNAGELIAFTRRRHRRVNVPAKTDALLEKMH